MSLWDFARASGSESLVEADIASVVASALRAFKDGQDLDLTPGAGLLVDGGQLHVAILGNSKRIDFKAGAIIPLEKIPLIKSRVVEAKGFDPEWVGKIVVMSIIEPERQIAPADAITGPSRGIIGTQVQWHSGTGFVTAGHVAPNVGATVYDGSAAIGIVVWANDPAGHGTLVEPDLAVIELHPGHVMNNPISAATSAGALATVSIMSTSTTATIMGFSQFLCMPSQNATCGDTYFTTAQVTQLGDSGSPVMMGNDLIGHVIGASPGVMSFIQDISYQLREGANPLRAGLPGLRM